MLKTYCRALVDSFYNPRAYRDALTQWQGFGGVYLMILTTLLAVAVYTLFLGTLNSFAKTELQHLAEQLPSITIQDGVIEVDGEQPVTIQSKTSPIRITIDTTKSESELRETGTEIGMGRSFIFAQIDGNYEVFYTEKLKDTSIILNKKTLLSLWERNIPTLKTVAFPLLWMGQYINLVLTGLIVAFLSYFVTTFMREEFTFLERMRLAVLAVTPAEIISMALQLGLQHKTAPWFPVLLALLYLYVMLILMRKLPPAQEHAA